MVKTQRKAVQALLLNQPLLANPTRRLSFCVSSQGSIAGALTGYGEGPQTGFVNFAD